MQNNKEMNNMSKRLCDMVQLESNTKDCAVFTVKPETSPMDLVKLGGFEGHECMFRMSKDPNTVCITVFRDGDEPYHMNYGSSTTLVSEDRRKVRELIMECVNLDFGIFTDGGRGEFGQLVEATLGDRDPSSPKNYELQHARDRYSLFVNDQHIVVTNPDDFETWLEDRGLALEVSSTRTSGLCPVDFGKMIRVDAPERANAVENAQAEPLAGKESFGDALDKAFDEFLGKTGWQGMDTPSAVCEFVRFAKHRMEPSLDELVGKAKDKAQAQNASRSNQGKSRRSPEAEL